MNPNAIIEGVVYRCKTSKGVLARKIACHIFRQFPDDPYDPYEIIWTYLYAPSFTHVKNGRCSLNTFASKCVCSLPIELDDIDKSRMRLRDWLSRGLNHRYYYQKSGVEYVPGSNLFIINPKYDTPRYITNWENKPVVYQEG